MVAMASSRSLRWAGNGISNGRQRLPLSLSQSRAYSSSLYTSSRRQGGPSRVVITHRHLSQAQQTRNLSLFGWGGSSKPSAQNIDLNGPLNNQSGSGNIDLDLSDRARTVKASLETSDAPDLSSTPTHLPNEFEPEALETLQQAITKPHSSLENVVESTSMIDEPERLGYLREVCGLDFGWGSSTIMESVLEHLHITAGLSWTMSIVALSFVMRITMLHPMVSSQKETSKMRDLKPVLDPLREEYKAATFSGDRTKAMQINMQMRMISKEAGIKYSRIFVPLLIQMPFQFGAFRVLRNAGTLPVPGFVTSDWLWTSDLSFSDPYFLTPLLSAGFIYAQFTTNMKAGNAGVNQNLTKMLSFVLPGASFVFMSFQPGAVQLYFMISSLCAFGTARLLATNWFRGIVGLRPTIPTITASSPGSTALSEAPAVRGLNRRELIKPIISKPATIVGGDTGPKKSFIDQGVDRVKGGWGDFQNSYKKAVDEFSVKQKAKTDSKKKEAAERYEYERQQGLADEREASNNRARQGNGSGSARTPGLRTKSTLASEKKR